jgi:hypothetical protein
VPHESFDVGYCFKKQGQSGAFSIPCTVSIAIVNISRFPLRNNIITMSLRQAESTPLLKYAGENSSYYFLNNTDEGGIAEVEGLPDGADHSEFEPRVIGKRGKVNKFRALPLAQKCAESHSMVWISFPRKSHSKCVFKFANSQLPFSVHDKTATIDTQGGVPAFEECRLVRETLWFQEIRPCP